MKAATELDISGQFEDLLENKEIYKAVYDDFLKIAKIGKLTKQEIPSKIYLEKEPWTPESGLMTDALKLKRTVCSFKNYECNNFQRCSTHIMKKWSTNST